MQPSTRQTSLLAFAAACALTPARTSSLAAQWNEITPSSSPSARATHGMAYDPSNSTTLLFGGDTFGFPVGASDETWSYDGSTWSQLLPAVSPPPSVGIRMVYDQLRGVFVTYGSIATSFFGGPSEDRTWEFDGTTWTEAFPINTPGGLGHYGMSYDSARNVTVLYGGLPNSFFPIDSNQTWEWNGIDWTQVMPATNPGPIERPGMCFHDALGVTVLFGGIDVQSGGTDETWLYDGTDWSVAPISGARPTVRTGCRLAYDSARSVVVMTGGQDPTNGMPFGDTWELDLVANAWTQVPSSYTDARLDQGLVFDAARRQVVLFGGANLMTFTAFGDTWELGARSETFGAGCAGSNGVPAHDAQDAPRLGQIYTLEVDNLNTAINLGVFAISTNAIAPTPLDGIGMVGCTGFAAPDVLLSSTGAAGSATVTLTLPSNIALLGAEVFSQALSFDPGVNALGLAASNGHRGVLGF